MRRTSLQTEILKWYGDLNGIWAGYASAEDKVSWRINALFDRETYESDWFEGAMHGSEWLDLLGYKWLQENQHIDPSYASASNSSEWNILKWLQYFRAKLNVANIFLDSFSIIEGGEKSTRNERTITPSASSKALTKMMASMQNGLQSLSPREFEVLVAATLAELGCDLVQLTRYSMDDGYDILVVEKSGDISETILVEVKHYRGTVGVAALDRLNGVRDRKSADRCLLVASKHISPHAIERYAAKTDIVSARTYSQIADYLSRSSTWKSTKGGLWSTSSIVNRDGGI